MKSRNVWISVSVLMMLLAAPVLPAQRDGGSATPDIVIHVDKLSTGNSQETVDFEYGGTDTTLSLSLPNGATVLGARMNITSSPHTTDGRDYPSNVTVDIGSQAPPEWQFMGTGYGDLGHQNRFVPGPDNSTLLFGMNDTNTSYFYLPKDADVTHANCTLNGSSTSDVLVKAGGQGTNVYPFGSGTAFRFQWLYLADEIGFSGILDKAGWKVNSGVGGMATLTNFKMLLCNTTVKALGTTFSANYGGATPVTVVDSASYQISESNGYVTLDPPDTFFYDNTKSLLIEVSFSDRSGTSFGLNAGSVGGASGSRRAWNRGDSTASSGSIDSSAYRYECSMEFISKLNMAVDICDDSVIDYTATSSEWPGANLEFTSTLINYMANAEENFTDPWGNTFVVVPLRIDMEYAGLLNFNGLSITYRYTTTIEEYEGYGTLADALSELLPSVYDGEYTNISIAISSDGPGKVTISGVSVDFRPPIHPPFLDSKDPASDVVVMNENESMEFRVAASDEYGYPLEPVWFIDTLEVARGEYSHVFSPDFESSGNHTISVEVNNTMRSVTATWKVQVLNVNRQPFIESFSPDQEVTINEEDSVNLGVVAGDPDVEDRELFYSWYVGSVDQKVSGDSFRFKTDLSSAGVHSIRVKVSDEGGLSASQTWKVTVLNVNVPPVVDTLAPNFNPNIRETDAATFSISASDFDKQSLTYRWYIDGEEAGSGQQYTYRSNYDSAGMHLVEVVISDGEANVTRSWTVTVENVNRMPVPVIDQPSGQLDFMDTELIGFSAVSSSDPDGDSLRYRWLEGSRELSSSAEFEARFTKGQHEVTLEVTDQNRASNRTSVKFNVHYIKLVANVDYDLLVPVEGKKLTFTAWVNNTGDAEATDVEVELLVDGTSLGRQTIGSVMGGGTGSAQFEWKAKKGEHVVTARIGGQSWNSTVTVAQKPAPPAADLTLPLLLVAVIAAAAAGGVAFALSRRKKAQAPAGERTEQAPVEAAAPAVMPPVAPAAAAAPAVVAAAPPPTAPPEDLEKRDRIRKLIISTEEKIADLLESPRDGIDPTAALEKVEQAKARLSDGDLDGALKLAKQARLALSATAAPAAAAAASKPEPAAKEEPGATRCPSCGEPIEAGWSICPACGRQV